jgi:quercetin dioxygenase-like cupin family protein
MITPGDALTNPATGETLVFRHTAAQSDGASVLVETIVEPGGFVAAAHVHPHQSERFEILEGLVELRVGRETNVRRPGDVAGVPAGTPHRFRNVGDTRAHFLCEIRPALQFESLIETMFALAEEGKTNHHGLPNPFRLAVIAQAHFDTVRLPFPPTIVQRAALTAAAPLGRLLGYEARTARREPANRPHTQPDRTYDRGRPNDRNSSGRRDRAGRVGRRPG